MTADPRINGNVSDTERYASGRMGESEELAFETRMLEDPLLAKEVEAIQRIREGLRALSARDELPEVRRARRPGPLYALAAALTVCVIGASVLPTFWKPHPVLTGTPASNVAHTLFLTQTRGRDEAAEVPATGVIELKILPAVAGETDRYRATLGRMGDEALVASNVEARSSPSGYVMLYLDTTRVAPGLYWLSLMQGSTQERFLLKVSESP